MRCKYISVLKSLYSDNYIHIKVCDSLSEQVAQNIGLTQDNNLSPNLFKLFLNNLPSCFDASDDQVVFENVSFSYLTYADDLVLISTTEKRLQSRLNKLSIFCDANGLTVNLKNTYIIIFSKSGRKSKTKFLFNNVEIKEVQSYKYLGILFSLPGTFS